MIGEVLNKRRTVSHKNEVIALLLKLSICENFAKFLKTPFLTEHLRWLLLKYHLVSHGISSTQPLQLKFTCSKSTIETLEKGVNMIIYDQS